MCQYWEFSCGHFSRNLCIWAPIPVPGIEKQTDAHQHGVRKEIEGDEHKQTAVNHQRQRHAPLHAPNPATSPADALAMTCPGMPMSPTFINTPCYDCIFASTGSIVQIESAEVNEMRIRRRGAGSDNWGFSSRGMVGFGEGGNSSWVDQEEKGRATDMDFVRWDRVGKWPWDGPEFMRRARRGAVDLTAQAASNDLGLGGRRRGTTTMRGSAATAYPATPSKGKGKIAESNNLAYTADATASAERRGNHAGTRVVGLASGGMMLYPFTPSRAPNTPDGRRLGLSAPGPATMPFRESFSFNQSPLRGRDAGSPTPTRRQHRQQQPAGQQQMINQEPVITNNTNGQGHQPQYVVIEGVRFALPGAGGAGFQRGRHHHHRGGAQSQFSKSIG